MFRAKIEALKFKIIRFVLPTPIAVYYEDYKPTLSEYNIKLSGRRLNATQRLLQNVIITDTSYQNLMQRMFASPVLRPLLATKTTMRSMVLTEKSMTEIRTVYDAMNRFSGFSALFSLFTNKIILITDKCPELFFVTRDCSKNFRLARLINEEDFEATEKNEDLSRYDDIVLLAGRDKKADAPTIRNLRSWFRVASSSELVKALGVMRQLQDRNETHDELTPIKGAPPETGPLTSPDLFFELEMDQFLESAKNCSNFVDIAKILMEKSETVSVSSSARQAHSTESDLDLILAVSRSGRVRHNEL